MTEALHSILPAVTHFPRLPASRSHRRASSNGTTSTGTLSLGNGLTSADDHPTATPGAGSASAGGPRGGGSKAHPRLPVQAPGLEATVAGEVTRTSNHAGSQDTELPVASRWACQPPPRAHLGGGIGGEGSAGG